MRPAHSQSMIINYLKPRKDEKSEERTRRETIRKKVDAIKDLQDLGEILSEPWDL